MKLGCDTVLFNQLDLYGALQHVAWAGYDGVQLAILANWARHIKLDTNQSYIDEVKETAKKHGLELQAINADVGGLPGEDRIKSMVTLFDVAHKLGVPIITFRSGGITGDRETLKQEIQYVKKISSAAESRGITLAFNPHTGGAIYNVETLIPLLDAVDSPALGLTFDPKELYRAGVDLSEYILRMGKKIVHANFRDYPERERPEATPEEQIPGHGNIDFPKILKNLKDIGYDADIDVVIVGAFWQPLSRQMGIAAEARGYLHRCLQELK